MFDTPIVYNFFLRPKISKRVFSEIKKIQPSKLYLISDGPRNPSESLLVVENRQQIESMIDWDCNVTKMYLDSNHGMDQTMELTYELVFASESKMIFLEEDILPSQSFFKFCDEMLDKYKDDETVFQISGMNFLGKYPLGGPSYFFVDTTSIWGMAIWKRTYLTMQKDLSVMDDPYYASAIRRLMIRRERFGYYQHLMLKKEDPEKILLDGEFWLMGFNQNILYNSLNIVPSVNLVLNLGDTDHSEHSDDIKMLPKRLRKLSKMQKYELDFPLIHPKYKIVDYEYKRLWNNSNPKFPRVSGLLEKIERAIRILIFGGYSKLLKKIKFSFRRYWIYSRHKNKFK